MSGEAHNRSTLGLPGAQEALFERVRKLGKPLVVVLMNGRPLAIPEVAEHAPAILETWYLGHEMGHAVADVLFGDVNPSGKLPIIVSAHGRSGAPLLQPQVHRPTAARRGGVHLEVPRRALDAAVPVRPRPELHARSLPEAQAQRDPSWRRATR